MSNSEANLYKGEGSKPEPVPGEQRAETHGTSRVLDLDAARAFAALAVLLGHLRNLFLVDFGMARSKGPIVQVVYLLSGFGHFAVVIFFVLSGYLITGSIVKQHEKGNWSWGSYALNRLVRLYVVLVPALLLGALIDQIGFHAFGNRGPYAGQDYAHMFVQPLAETSGFGVGLGNALFLQGIACPTFGTNGPLWSLSYEFWYYALFPLIFVALRPGKAWGARAGCLLLVAGISLMTGPAILASFPIWLLGSCLVAMESLVRRRSILMSGAGLALLFFTLLFVRTHPAISPIVSDYLVGFVFALCLLTAMPFRQREATTRVAKSISLVAEMSYSLYLVHVPLLTVLSLAILGSGGRWQPDAGHLATTALVGVGALGYAYVVYFLTESRTGWVRSKLKSGIARLQGRVRYLP